MRATEFLKELDVSNILGRVLGANNTDSSGDKLNKFAGTAKLKQSTKPSPSRSLNFGQSARVEDDGSVIIGNQKRSGGTISWRTNNPGNVMHGNFAKSYGSLGAIKAADSQPVAIMPTLEQGWKMQMDLWRRPAYNNGTIDQGARRWAGAVGAKRETSQYTIDLANAAGVPIHTKVANLSDDQLKRLVKKQAQWEGFKPGTVTQI